MKNYKDYVFEAVLNPDFNSDFEVIIDKIDEFWEILDEAFDKLESINARNPQEAANDNAQKKIAPVKPIPPEKMKNGALIQYSYVTNSGNTIIVTIDTPDNGTNTNTAIVKPIKPIKGTKIYPFPAKWTRLIPIVT